MKKLNFQLIAILFTAFALGFTACTKEDDTDDPSPEQDEYTIVDNGTGTGTTTWKSGKTYFLDGFVFVNENSIKILLVPFQIKGL